MKLITERLRLSPWQESDRQVFTGLYANPLATRDFGRVLTSEESGETFDKYIKTYDDHGFTRWKLTLADETFIGTNGLMRVNDHPDLGTHDEIGWRMLPEHWGKGYATEAAIISLEDAQTRCGLRNILTYTTPQNKASRAVMERLNFKRQQALDFTTHLKGFPPYHLKVWTVPNPDEMP